jgi:glyoxylase-like metal-dependent hydrolase (beta-lactamase superfamily II)
MAHVPSRTRKKIEWLLRRGEGALLPEHLLAEEGAHLEPHPALHSLGEQREGVAVVGVDTRVDQLTRAVEGKREDDRRAYIEQHGVAGVQRFHSKSGARIYSMSVETFPKHVNNVYLVLEEGSAILFDCGSGLGFSQRDLALGFAVVREAFGETARYEDLDWCVVSHAHYDHFGGANVLKRQSRARLAVHELDARVLSCFGERMVIASKDCDIFWRRAGVEDTERAGLLTMYTAAKGSFRPEEVDRVLRDGDIIGPGYRVHHVPGHCPGLN